jgi:hypothetical protein
MSKLRALGIEKGEEDKKTVYTSKASKGFSKHISPELQLCLGFGVVLMSITPAIFFTITLILPYYSVHQSNCNIPLLKNLTEWGSNPLPLPVATYYQRAQGIVDMSQEMEWVFEEHWTMYLHAGMCPNGKMEGDNDLPDQDWCLPWIDTDATPNVWQSIDLYNQLLIGQGNKDIMYSDMEAGAKNFKQAWQMTIPSCAFAWVFILVSIFVALHTDEHIELEFDKDVHGFDHHKATPEQIAEHILHIDEKETEHADGDASYTKAIAAEFIIYLMMFGNATSILKLVEEGDFVEYPQSWQGFFPTCTMSIVTEPSVYILYYQAISMGIYVGLLFFAEVYYISEYITHCMHHYLTHPDEQLEIQHHADSTGDHGNIPKEWKGPKFMTRLHLLKVRAVKTVFYGVHNSVFEETEHGQKFREAHEGAVALSEHKDKLKSSHRRKAGHDDHATSHKSAKKKLNQGDAFGMFGIEEEGHGHPPQETYGMSMHEAREHSSVGVKPKKEKKEKKEKRDRSTSRH